MTETAPSLTASSTLTDFDGQETSGKVDLRVQAAAHQTLSLVVQAPEYGHYRLQVTVNESEREVARFTTTLTRIRSRDMAWSPDSPFGMCWGVNSNLTGLAGVKKERVGTGMGGEGGALEPLEGVLMPDVSLAEGAMPAYVFGWTAQREYAKRGGIRKSEMLSYGEPWVG